MKLYSICTIIILLSGCSSVCFSDNTHLEPENTYVVLIEKDNYPPGYSDIDVDFTNITQLKELFIRLGVPEENIRFVMNDLGEQGIEDSFAWLYENAPEDAAVFYYIGAHGRYLRRALRWNFLVPPQWEALPQENKIMIVDSCNAGEFVAPFMNKKDSGITYGVVAADELNWWGEEIENLPIIGSIWVKYFIDSFETGDSDLNSDGLLSFSEAHEFADSRMQKYMKEYVFGRQDYLQSFIDLGHDPSEKPAYPNAVMNHNIDSGLILYRFKD